MKCKCGSDRIFSLSAKSSDLNFWKHKGYEHDGYLPTVHNVCSGDYVDIDVCLDCGQLQGDWPVTSPTGELDCPECGEYIELTLGDTNCYSCEAELFPKAKEPEVRVHGGDCEVQVPVKKCRLLVPIEFAGYEIGRELFIERESPEFFYVEIMHNWVKLTKGVEAEGV